MVDLSASEREKGKHCPGCWIPLNYFHSGLKKYINFLYICLFIKIFSILMKNTINMIIINTLNILQDNCASNFLFYFCFLLDFLCAPRDRRLAETLRGAWNAILWRLILKSILIRHIRHIARPAYYFIAVKLKWQTLLFAFSLCFFSSYLVQVTNEVPFFM